MARIAEDAMVESLQALATTQQLRQRAIDACRNWLQSEYSADDFGGMSPDSVELVFERCALVFDHGQLTHPFVETSLGLWLPDPGRSSPGSRQQVGHYTLITRLDGTDEDDCLVLDDLSRPNPSLHLTGSAVGDLRVHAIRADAAGELAGWAVEGRSPYSGACCRTSLEVILCPHVRSS